jgi:carbamoyl-phosphate synthase large subunit
LTGSAINILMTGAGAPGAPGIIHCLLQDPRINLFTGVTDPEATGRFLNKNFILLPKATDTTFAKFILETCRKKNIRVVMPLVTKELLPLAEAQQEFREEGIRVMVSEEKTIRIANNKSSCYSFLKDHEIRVPEFYVVKNIHEFVDAAEKLGYPQNNFCFKPSESNGSRGVRIVSGKIDEADLLFNQKPGHLFITYEHAQSILSSTSFPELLVSEYLPGQEYSVDVLADDGKAILVLPRSRKKMIGGISVRGTFVEDKMIITYCEKIIRAMKLHGNIGIQVKLSTGGEPLLIEINPRVQGSIVAAMGAGINLPLLAVQMQMGEQIPSEFSIRWNASFSRYWTEVFY